MSRSIYSRRYHVALANPPYTVPSEKSASDAYRARYVSAHRKFGMGVCFTERMFELLVPGGHVAQITSNAFMKREYGKPLIERVLPHYDTTHVIDTSGAYIPGHGTPTVILAGRNRAPSPGPVRVVQARRGETETPRSHVGDVWNSIRAGLGLPAEVAPSGAQPIGLAWAKALAPSVKALAAEFAGPSSGDYAADATRRAETTRAAAAWHATAAALCAFNVRRAYCTGHALPDEHLAASFARVATELPDGEWFDDWPWNGAAQPVNPCWGSTLTSAQSDRVRAAVAAVVDLRAIPREQADRTDWIGDIYQGLDDVAREDFAFCQTPWFASKLLAELAVEPALREFGDGATVIDPACGTGHLLLEAFRRIHLRRADPEDGAPEHIYSACARMALSQLAGGDINPVVAAICRWRMMLAYVDAEPPRSFSSVPDDLPINVEVADALTTERPIGHVDHAKAHPSPTSPAAPPRPARIADALGQLSLFGGSP